MKRNWFDIKVLILGFSRSGIAAARYLATKGANCYITEKKPLQDKDKDLVQELNNLGIKTEFGGHNSSEFLEDVHLAITSPGIPPHSEILKTLKEKNITVISEIELSYLETTIPFIAITGTNGKTTTTELTSFILSKDYNAPTCGNIGIPPIGLISEKHDYLVCELSSYQIAYSPSFKAQIAMFLNFTPDHIDWHEGLENYFKDKSRIFLPPQNPAFAIFNALDEKVCSLAEKCKSEIFYFGKEFGKNCCYVKNSAIYFKRDKEEYIIDLKEVPLVGEHNYQNVMASIIAAKIIGMENEKIKEKIMNFKAVEHRCEFVKTVNGVSFYNDSKATNPEAAIVAITAFPDKKVSLIAGGRDKMTDLSIFCEKIKEHIDNVILIGEATERFEKNLLEYNFNKIYKSNSLENAIEKAKELEDEIVLLSPACASFDMFENYEVRGKVFKEYVTEKL